MKQRQPFDIFEDQYEKLKRIAETEKEFENGRSMSQMVRDAIDQYFKYLCIIIFMRSGAGPAIFGANASLPEEKISI